jgi:hypothetical protein
MKISSTLTQVGGNFARPTKYSMILTPPSALRTSTSQTLDVLCKTVQAPGITNEPYEIKVKGQPIKVPGRTIQNQEITVTFYVDEYYNVRKLFQDWILALDNRSQPARSLANNSVMLSRDFYGTLELIGRDFNETTAKPIVWEFESVFPTNIGEMDFNTSDKDTISELSVTFTYSRYNTRTLKSRDIIENSDNNINRMRG